MNESQHTACLDSYASVIKKVTFVIFDFLCLWVVTDIGTGWLACDTKLYDLWLQLKLRLIWVDTFEYAFIEVRTIMVCLT